MKTENHSIHDVLAINATSFFIPPFQRTYVGKSGRVSEEARNCDSLNMFWLINIKMGKKFRNKYRIESNRLRGWNYAANGSYFITIVTYGRKHWFGKIINGVMILSDFGKIADDEWNESFEIRNELYLDEYIIMPNHFHAIVIINKTDKKNQTNNPEKLNKFNNFYGLNNRRDTHGRAYLRSAHSGKSIKPGQSNNTDKSIKSQKLIQTGKYQKQSTVYNPGFNREPESISSFIGGFKSATINSIDDFIDANNLKIKKFNKKNHLWQSNFHDHIIRNESEYYRIKNYIINNPNNWKEDKFNKE